MRVVRTIETRATTTGTRETAAALNEVAGAYTKVGTAAAATAEVTETSARRSGTLAGAYERERRALDPLVAAREKYERTMRNLDRGLSAGADVGEHARLADLARSRFDRLTGANDNLTRSIGLQRHEWVNLGRQMQDVGTMAAMGAPAMQIFTSQAAQIYDVLASSQGGVKGALKEVGSTMLALVTPGRLAFAGVAAGAGLALVALSRATSQANEFNRALNVGAGTRSGVTRGDITGIVAGSSDFSRGEGRATALAYAGAGASRENTAAAFGLTRGLADVMYDGDTGAARKGLSDAMRGGTAALMKYVSDIRPLGAATTDWIEKLAASQGDQAANAELLKMLNEGIRGAGVEVPLWRDGLRKLGNAASDLADDFLRNVGKGADLAARIAQASGLGPSSIGQGRSTDLSGFLLRRSQSAATSISAAGSAGANGAGALGDANIGAAIARGRAGSEALLGLNKTYDADGEALRKLKIDLTAYDRLLKDNAVTQQMTKEQLEAAEKAQRQLAGAVESYVEAEEKRRKSDELTLRSINARTDAERTLIAVEQKRQELSGQKIDPADRQRALDAVRAQEDARNARGLEDRRRRLDEMNASLKVQRESFGLSDEAAEAMRIRLDMMTEATRNSQTVVERYGKDWETLAAQMAKAKVATDDLTRAQQNVIQGMDEMRSGSRSAMTGLFSDLRQGKDPRQALLGSFNRMTDQFFDRMISKPLTESLLGRDGQANGGLFGGALSSILGGGMSTSAMTVNAASVTIGGVGGLTAGIPGLSGAAGGAGAIPGSAASGGGLFSGLLGILGLSGSAAVTATSGAAMSGRTLVQDAAGRVLSLSAGGASALTSPLSVAGLGSAGGGASSAFGLASGAFGNWSIRPGVNTAGLDDRLLNILRTAAGEQGRFDVRLTSGVRLGDMREHGRGGAADIQLVDRQTGKPLGNYQDAGAFREYELFAQKAREVQMRDYPDLAQDLRWGGYFSGGRGRYGALDTMHFDLAGRRTGMGGGSWEGGLSPAQRELWPGAVSRGIGPQSGLDQSKDLSSSADQAAKSIGDLSQSVGQIPDAASTATNGLSALTSALSNIKVGDGGGLNLAGVFGGGSSGASFQDVATWSANGNIMTSRGPLALNYYEKGGIATSPQLSVFGEGRLPEAYVPLPDGRSIPVTMKDARPQTAPTASNSNGGSFTYHEAPIQSAAGVTPEQWIAARQQDRAQVMRDFKRNFGAVAAEHQRRFG